MPRKSDPAIRVKGLSVSASNTVTEKFSECAFGSRVQLKAYGAVGLSERFMYDDKLVCAHRPVTATERALILRFFHFYARCKALLNALRGEPGRARCEGWGDASAAILRAIPVEQCQRKPVIGY